ncbi:Hypothetical predicted protein [Paramuricea clavata]|uniref:Uncharacterized protein n=1 Tax=Paramuricea clavata TaxID=317549 RepID=A0A6S7ID02_PARCT|nr:Hypothetical predicted protein [Paramuricea clavata]
MAESVEYKAAWMERVSGMLDEYDEEYSDIWEGDLSNAELEELDTKYPGYREMDVTTMDSELDVLSRKSPEGKGKEAKAGVRKSDYGGKLTKVKGVLEKLGFDPNEPEEELQKEEELRQEEARKKKEEEDRRKEEEKRRLEEQKKLEEERKKHMAEVERKRIEESIKAAAAGEKEEREYWKRKLEEWDKERAKPKEPEKVKPKKQPEDTKEQPKKQPKEQPEKVKPKEKPEKETSAEVDSEWVDETYNFESLLFQTVEDTISVEDQPVYSGDTKEILLRNVREDLTRYEKFKSWVERNFAGILAGITVSVAALLTTIIILSRKLASVTAEAASGCGGPSPSPSDDPNPGEKVIKFLSSNLWVIAIGLALLCMRR